MISLPEDKPVVINFSGGRSSAYMLYLLLEHYHYKLPDHVYVIFCNTGKERPETLDFVYQCQTRWDVPIVWLEYRCDVNAKGGREDPKHKHIVVNYNTASRNGKPFSSLCYSKRFLPSVTRRICTVELKVETINRFLRRDHGIRDSYRVLGIRADEQNRIAKAKMTLECSILYPLAEAGINKQDVDSFWSNNDFDLAIDSNLGNCDLCFLKSRGKIIKALRDEPQLAMWWIRLEQTMSAQRPSIEKKTTNQFRIDSSYLDLLEDSFLPDEPEEIQEDWIDCYCGVD